MDKEYGYLGGTYNKHAVSLYRKSLYTFPLKTHPLNHGINHQWKKKLDLQEECNVRGSGFILDLPDVSHHLLSEVPDVLGRSTREPTGVLLSILNIRASDYFDDGSKDIQRRRYQEV